MEIEFELEMKDWMELQKNHLNNSKQVRKSKIISTWMLPVLISVLMLKDIINGYNLDPLRFILFGILAILWVLYIPKGMMKRMLNSSRKMLLEGDNSGIFGIHKMSFNDEGFVHFEPESENKIKWTAIKKLEATETHYFLYNTGMSAIIIPKYKIGNEVNSLDIILKNNIVSRVN